MFDGKNIYLIGTASNKLLFFFNKNGFQSHLIKTGYEFKIWCDNEVQRLNKEAFL